MKSRWLSYGNSYLRHLESPRSSKDRLTISTQSLQELQVVLEQTLKYVKRMNTGKVETACPITIKYSELGSEEIGI